jgi:hypothetical protein
MSDLVRDPESKAVTRDFLSHFPIGLSPPRSRHGINLD